MRMSTLIPGPLQSVIPRLALRIATPRHCHPEQSEVSVLVVADLQIGAVVFCTCTVLECGGGFQGLYLQTLNRKRRRFASSA